MKKRDQVKTILTDCENTRNDDVLLYTQYGLLHKGLTFAEYSNLIDLMRKVGSFESIRRARQLVQADFPELGPTNPKVISVRNSKEARARITKGRSVPEDDWATHHDLQTRVKVVQPPKFESSIATK